MPVDVECHRLETSCRERWPSGAVRRIINHGGAPGCGKRPQDAGHILQVRERVTRGARPDGQGELEHVRHLGHICCGRPAPFHGVPVGEILADAAAACTSAAAGPDSDPVSAATRPRT